MKSLDITIIMPTYNRAKLLRENIENLLKSDHFFELLIIDDCSQDKTEEVIKSFEDRRITYLRHDSNQGQAKSLNQGISLARNPQVMLCEDDAFIVNPDRFFSLLCSELEWSPMVGTRLLVNGKEPKSDFKGRIKRFFAEPLAKEIYVYNGHRRKTVRFCSACFAFRKDIVKTRFDEDAYLHNVARLCGMETSTFNEYLLKAITPFRIESDFQIRAERKGVGITYNPELVVDHRHHVKGGYRLNNARSYVFQSIVNHMVFLRKYYATWNVHFYVLLKCLSHPSKLGVIRKAMKTYAKLARDDELIKP